MLDVGQGLAVVIERQGAAFLYDTGLARPDGDSGQQIIIPWLRWHHLQLEGSFSATSISITAVGSTQC